MKNILNEQIILLRTRFKTKKEINEVFIIKAIYMFMLTRVVSQQPWLKIQFRVSHWTVKKVRKFKVLLIITVLKYDQRNVKSYRKPWKFFTGWCDGKMIRCNLQLLEAD